MVGNCRLYRPVWLSGTNMGRGAIHQFARRKHRGYGRHYHRLCLPVLPLFSKHKRSLVSSDFFYESVFTYRVCHLLLCSRRQIKDGSVACLLRHFLRNCSSCNRGIVPIVCYLHVPLCGRVLSGKPESKSHSSFRSLQFVSGLCV